jgi:PAS domain S-box-containing protein
MPDRMLEGRASVEERLRASEARWRAVIESAVDGIVVIDERGAIEAFNPAAERLFGYTEAEVIGHNVSMLMPSPYHEEHDGYLARYRETGVHRIIGIGREVTGRRKDGTTFPLHLSVGEASLAGERKFTGILHDLSARVAMEAQLREQNAMARLGEMAAVLAHEVKNPLAAVRGAVEVIGSRLPTGTRDATVVKEIVSRIDSLDDLMKDLLLFARPPQPAPRLVDIPPLVAATAELLREDPAFTGVHIDVEGSGVHVVADPGLLRIVFFNLMLNSAQAMRGEGRITVSVQAADGWCRIVFQDSGPGIPPDIRDKIFTPFFTTKSRGTGLGLPTAKRFVEALRGTIDVVCPPNGGTVIVVQLPSHL